ncbi:MAG TPA: ATP-binding cassette domain-containing protein [Candidatus Dojkabacteria bacterium]|nr:ATP-binding cassette domain-containing protein [Candidatus Dojkabacteria bacterium]
MIIKATGLTKEISGKVLYKQLNFEISSREKVALIGRNGCGKTTLFNILSGKDKDFHGQIEYSKDIRIVKTEQEHIDIEESVLEYILGQVPDYYLLNKIIKGQPDETTHLLSNGQRISYFEAIEIFTDRGYFHIEDNIVASLNSFGLATERALVSMQQLSGGEKRIVELVKIMYSGADLALIDEPTNHMDYEAKEVFIKWFRSTKIACVVITHDRDVLHEVGKIFEIKDGVVIAYNGNYEWYLSQNSFTTVTKISKYENDLMHVNKLKKQMKDVTGKKLSAKSNKGRERMKILEERLKREYKSVTNNMEKPSFWIDEENLESFSEKVVETYNKYKTEGIKISKINTGINRQKLLIKVTDVVLGYTFPLFNPINFELIQGDVIRFVGKNGAGKTTFIKYLLSGDYDDVILDKTNTNKEKSKGEIIKYQGEIKVRDSVKLGLYEQEVKSSFLHMPLVKAVETVLVNSGQDLNPTNVRKFFADYLFDYFTHSDVKVANLSGGEKARFQIFSMLASKPDIVILDEPTNHLDLPSIEELERYMFQFTGAIIYVSHDTYFASKMGGKVINFEK